MFLSVLQSFTFTLFPAILPVAALVGAKRSFLCFNKDNTFLRTFQDDG